jgi:hypothetical protein
VDLKRSAREQRAAALILTLPPYGRSTSAGSAVEHFATWTIAELGQTADEEKFTSAHRQLRGRGYRVARSAGG